MKKLTIFIVVMLIAAVAYAVDSTKPSTHNTNWIELHGNSAKANEAECLMCHEDRNECIMCHEDTSPRSHTSTFVNRTHGMESRWNKTSCQTCHRQDFCDACHETAYPMSHNRTGFADRDSVGFHCNTSCQLTSSNWKMNPAQNCIVCHQTRPIISNPDSSLAGQAHPVR